MSGIAGGPRVVAIGGGHGLAVTLAATRRYAGEITAVVSVADDGGSSGRVRRSVGIPAPGDLRRCLVALADPDSVWAKVFDHRFGAGDLEGHALGNLIIAGLSEATGDFGTALEEAAQLLGVGGRVLPVTTTATTLQAWVGGAGRGVERMVVGEVEVNEADGPIGSVSVLGPDGAPSRADDEVLEAVAKADQVIIGPGSLYTSVLAACVVPGICEALSARSGGRVYVANLAPEHAETDGMTLADHLGALVRHEVNVDAVVYDPAAFLPTSSSPVGGPGEAVRLVAASVAGPGGRSHDVGQLATVLMDLARGG